MCGVEAEASESGFLEATIQPAYNDPPRPPLHFLWHQTHCFYSSALDSHYPSEVNTQYAFEHDFYKIL